MESNASVIGPKRPSEDREQMPPVVRELADELLPQTPQLARGLAAHLETSIPDLNDADESLKAELLASNEANIAQVLRLLRLGASPAELVVPVEVAGFMRGLVHRGIGLAAMLRTYRVGHAWFWDQWAQALRQRVGDVDALAAAQDRSSAFMFAYIDLISDVLVSEYGSERERLVRSAEQLRVETVRSLLAGEQLDEETAVGRLGYELRRCHVAVRVTATGSEIRGLDRCARELAAALGAPEPLVITSGIASLDAWIGTYDAPEPAVLDAFIPPDGIRVAVGGAGKGVAGFRASHEQAVHAARVAGLADGAARVTRYAQIEHVSLLCTDLPRARAFVVDRLGPLAAADEPTARLRETVLAVLAAGGSTSRVAKELYIHQNTVGYRIKKAEELIGRRLTDDVVELTAALTLAGTLGAAVLAEGDVTEG